MEARFRALQGDDGPFAQWAASPYNQRGDQWYIGGDNQKARENFRWVADEPPSNLGNLPAIQRSSSGSIF